ncbi:MAG: protein kinase domain-containing protein [Phycisphaerales bacterium]
MADADKKRCPQCGAELPPGSPANICPACLLKQGLAENTEGFSESTRASGGRGWQPLSVEQIQPYFPELEMLQLLGRGGMGAVYKARQKNLDRLVALKILPPQIGQDSAFAERFTREAQALARLSHPHIVTIHDFGRREGTKEQRNKGTEGRRGCISSSWNTSMV